MFHGQSLYHAVLVSLSINFKKFLQVGINVFVTGGIGGVHRHGESSTLNSYILMIETIGFHNEY
jgi:hypothetical protein